MAQYIDKDALVAEINKRIIDVPINNIGHPSVWAQHVWAYNDVKNIIETLEMNVVDLEKEIEEYIYQLPHSATGACGRSISVMAPLARKYGVVHAWRFDEVSIIARHFYELGRWIKCAFEGRKKKES